MFRYAGRFGDDDSTALRPAIPVLTEYDTITKRDDPDDPAVLRFAHLVGAAHGAAGADATPAHVHSRKAMHRSEERILRRIQSEWQTLVVDVDDIDSTDWLSIDWADPKDSRPPALTVRISGKTLRSVSSGFETFCRSLLAATGTSAVVGVWGIRATPGARVDRAVIVLSRNTP